MFSQTVRILAFAFIVRIVSAQTTWYVQGNGTQGGVGTQASPFGSIQQAIQSSVGGDTILVAPGIYTENLNFLGKPITVRGTGGALVTTVSAGQFGPTVTFSQMETAASRLDQLTVTHQTGYSGNGIVCVNSSPTISNCRILSNTVSDLGAGIQLSNSSAVISDCTISGNRTFGQRGGGISTYFASPRISHCTLSMNRTQGGVGGGLSAISSSITVVDSSFLNNFETYRGGGADFESLVNCLIENCTFEGNSATYTGGLRANSGSMQTLRSCVFTSNSAAYDGGGLGLFNLTIPKVERCRFVGNSVTNDYGGGFRCSVYSNLKIVACEFTNNSTGSWGGGLYSSNSLDSIESCIFRGNTAPNGLGAGAVIYSSTAIVNCTFFGNSAASCGSAVYFCCSGNVVNCVAWANSGSQVFCGNPGCFYNCLIQNGINYCNTLTQTSDPLFAAPPLDLRLSALSPCRDAGTASAFALPLIDFEGAPRVTGSAVDIGADEYGPLIVAKSSTANIGAPFVMSLKSYPAAPLTPYFFDLSVDGSSPGILLPPPHVGAFPLNQPYLNLSYGPLLPGFFTEFAGILDLAGSAYPTFHIPDLPPLIGVTFWAAGLTLDPIGPDFLREVSNSFQTTILDHAPTITSIVPNTSPTSGGAPITIHGAHFNSGTTLTVGSSVPNNLTIVDDSTITFTTFGAGLGAFPVVVTNPDQQSVTIPSGLTYIPNLSVSSVSPLSAPLGASVTLYGDGFQNGLSLTVGGAPAQTTSLTVNQVTFLMPANASCDGSIMVANPSLQTGSIPFNASPVISSVSGNIQPAVSGGIVNITGNNFFAGTSVALDGLPLPIYSQSINSLQVNAPAGTPGNLPLVVSSPSGCTATTTFYYLGPPHTVNSIVPDTGPISGGTPSVITGQNFLPGATVRYGSTLATNVTVVSSSVILCVTPTGSLGPAQITLTNGDSQVLTIPAAFTYLPDLSISQIQYPSVIPGATVSVLGTGFQTGLQATLNGSLLTLLSASPTLLTFVMPSGLPCDTLLVVSNPSTQVATTVFNPTPTINGGLFLGGPSLGGAAFYVFGNHFYPGTTVTVGGTPALIVGTAPNALVVIAPAGTPGPATVLISSPSGCTTSTTYLYN